MGGYADANSLYQPMIYTETAGTWSSARVDLSSLGGVSAYLSRVTCVSVDNCVVVGGYEDANTLFQGLVLTETNGTWKPVEVDLSALTTSPDGVSTHPNAFLNEVACLSAGNCTAVGNYYDASGTEQLMVVTETNGSWAPASQLDLSALSTSPYPDIYQLSCASAGNCVVVGSYADSSNDRQGLILTETNGVWASAAADLSGLSTSLNPNASLAALSCPSAGNCTAVGHYQTAAGIYQPLLVTETGGIWEPAVSAALPADSQLSNLNQRDLWLNSVSCASVGNCTAVGSYDATASNEIVGLTLTESAGHWAQGTQAALPSGDQAATNPEMSLDSISCSSATSCEVAGTYETATGDNGVLAGPMASGALTSVGVSQQTAFDAFGQPGVYNWASLSCAPSGYCATTGYTESSASGNPQIPFVLDAPGAAGSASASVSGTQASISWSAPADNGGLPVTGYTVVANDLTHPASGGQKVSLTAAQDSATFTGLAPGDSYTFSVTAESAMGTGLASTTNTVQVPAPTPATTTPPTVPQRQTGPSRGQIYRSLRLLLRPHGPHGRLARLRRAHAFAFSYRPLESGRVSVRWYEVTGHGKHRRRHLVGSGTASTLLHHLAHVRVHLSRLGRSLVARGQHLRLLAVVVFHHGRMKVSREHSFTLS